MLWNSSSCKTGHDLEWEYSKYVLYETIIRSLRAFLSLPDDIQALVTAPADTPFRTKGSEIVEKESVHEVLQFHSLHARLHLYEIRVRSFLSGNYGMNRLALRRFVSGSIGAYRFARTTGNAQVTFNLISTQE